MRRIGAVFFLACLATSMSATPIQVKQARSVALSFLKSNFTQTKGTELDLNLVWSDAETTTKTVASQEATFYVFNRSDGAGFVAVAGDDAVYPILGYGTKEVFKTDSMPANLRTWFDSYQRQINWVREQKRLPAKEVEVAWGALRRGDMKLKAGGTQLTTVLWDQMNPYNGLCPTINGGRVPTGCVATSTAIAMQYHKWPDVGVGSHSYTSETYNLALSATFNTPYAWNNMPSAYTNGQYTAQQAQNVATLMYDCGVFSDMNYAPGNSGAQTLTAARGLVDYMKYDKSLQVLQRDNYQTQEWESLVKGEINLNRPVIYGGENNLQEGHQFILEGYDDNGYFLVNWGWSGLANGYYRLAALEPEIQGTGGNSGGGFNLYQDAVFNMKPAVAGSSYQDVVSLFAGESGGVQYRGISTTATSIVPNVEFIVNAGFIGNFSLREFEGLVVIALVNEVGTVKQFVSDQLPISLEIGSGTAGEFPCTVTASLTSGDRIRVMYKSQDATDWQWVRGGGATTAEIAVDNPTSSEKIENPANVSIAYTSDGNVVVTSLEGIQEIALYDTNGRLLKRQPVGNNTSASFLYNEYSTGIHILKIRMAKGSSSHKLIRN